MKTNLPVLVLSDTILLPSSEIRMNFDSSLEKKLFSLSEGYYDSTLLIIHNIIDLFFLIKLLLPMNLLTYL